MKGKTMVKSVGSTVVTLSTLALLIFVQPSGLRSVAFASPTFSWGGGSSVPGVGAITMADFDGDGLKDVAAAVNAAGFGVQILISQGDGTFAAGPAITLTGTAPSNIAAADLDSDGDADIIVGTSSMTFAGLVPGDLNFIYNLGGGNFSAPTAYTFGNLISGITCADFNNDNIEDVVTINGVLGQMNVLIGNGVGSFTTPNTVSLPTSDQGVVQVASDDLNGDGNADLIVPCPLMDVVAIFYGNGQGGFNAAVSYPAGNDPKRVDFGDLNGDGMMDMLVTNWVADHATIMLQVAGGFSVSGTLQLPAIPPNPIGNSNWVDVIVSDFDQDGIQDVAIPSSQALVTFAGIGNGTFAAPQNWPMVGEWSQLQMADLDADGILDIVGLNWTQDSVDSMINGASLVENFRRGDVNRDGGVNITDGIAILLELFVTNSPPIPCPDAADIDDNGGLDLSDAVNLLSYLFVSGSPAPPAPGPSTCGTDPTPDALSCGLDPCP
ncbi:MAG: FG-GAP-like repeat-containing protein [Planctomycetota bacterium]